MPCEVISQNLPQKILRAGRVRVNFAAQNEGHEKPRNFKKP